jgi:hypothetical protein
MADACIVFEKLQIMFQSGCIIIMLHSYKESMGDEVASIWYCHHFLFYAFEYIQ